MNHTRYFHQSASAYLARFGSVLAFCAGKRAI
jgi:hypothetical protein